MAELTPKEHAERRARVDQSLASVRLAGLEPTEEAKAIFERYVAGELTVDETGEQIDALNARRYGRGRYTTIKEK